jgi:THO complex subunit 4
VKKAGLNFDENGRSKGTAEIIFASPASAQKAIQTYNGVKLDGRPLKIELIGAGGGLGGSLAGRLSGVGAGGRTVTFNAGRGGSGGRGGRKVVAKVVSAPRGKKGAAGAAKGAGGRGAKGGGRGGKGGRGPKPKKATPMTQEQLDAQLDSYKAGAAAAPAGDVAMME